ncbi:DNA-invertase hin [Planctomycetes bacterium Poly30]|uniref:DNA-invertase hin n=1 Tax=Saltatorellus ferox TaxID=2528018 RepID=A0A518ET39_9BACT|nr:DNA-invertase hin [Planctomycetes bacterium Poly30]
MAPSIKAKQVRVAIYTRKSVNEGLDQQFNSLDAQREFVEAYVKSHAGDGWVALDARYDDGGFSGATTDRPAFQRLIQDIKDGQLDVLAVYRLDRLSRSIDDFAQLMRLLEKRNVAFVSVTERFDTTSPMGRMVLNLLASFAQFERETIAQRTRDKMSASRRRGMWTGGRPVLGYDVFEKALVVNEAEAVTVRRIFQTYLDLGGCVAVAEELGVLGIRNKAWVNQAGEQTGGAPFNSSTIHWLLTNSLYRGLVRAQDDLVEGQHDAIVDEELWDRVQRKLKAQAPGGKSRPKRKTSAMLSGIARCRCGAALTPTNSKRKAKVYRYYICSRAQKQGKGACPGTRIGAGKLEEHVVEQIRRLGKDPRIVEAALLQGGQQRAEERTRLQAGLKDLNRSHGELLRKQNKLVAAMGDQGTSAALSKGLKEVEEAMADINERIEAARRDLQALDKAGTSADGLIQALAEFTAVWDTLTLDEQARLLDLILDAVVYDGPSGAIEIRLRDMEPIGAEAAA